MAHSPAQLHVHRDENELRREHPTAQRSVEQDPTDLDAGDDGRASASRRTDQSSAATRAGGSDVRVRSDAPPPFGVNTPRQGPNLINTTNSVDRPWTEQCGLLTLIASVAAFVLGEKLVTDLPPAQSIQMAAAASGLGLVVAYGRRAVVQIGRIRKVASAARGGHARQEVTVVLAVLLELLLAFVGHAGLGLEPRCAVNVCVATTVLSVAVFYSPAAARAAGRKLWSWVIARVSDIDRFGGS